MEDKNTSPTSGVKEDRIFFNATQLLQKGHRMTHVFKYVRERVSDDDDMHGRIMERLTSDNEVEKINEPRLEKARTANKKRSTQMIIGIVIIILVLLLMKYLI